MKQNKTGQLSPEQDAAILLPRSLFQTISSNSSNDTGLFVSYYNSTVLFPVGQANTANSALRQIQVCSRVIAATIGQNISFENLDEPVTVLLRILVKDGVVSKVFFHTWKKVIIIFVTYSSQSLVLMFVFLGISTYKTGLLEVAVITCHCNHLTNFAVLVVTLLNNNNMSYTMFVIIICFTKIIITVYYYSSVCNYSLVILTNNRLYVHGQRIVRHKTLEAVKQRPFHLKVEPPTFGQTQQEEMMPSLLVH